METPEFRNKPWWLWFTGHGVWVTIAPAVYVPGALRPEDHPEIIAHECVHLARQVTAGRWLWLLRYVFSRGFRLNEEAVAIAREIEVSPRGDRGRIVAFYSEALSGRGYCWAAKSREVAAAAIGRAESANSGSHPHRSLP